MGNYNRKKLKNSSRYLHKKRNKRITKKLQKICWGEFSAERLRKVKMRVFRKKNKLDCKAVEIAKKIYPVPYAFSQEENGVIKVDTWSLWERYMEVYMRIDDLEVCEIRQMKGLLSAIRKAIKDGFPIENTYLHEIPFEDNEMLVAYFVNKDDLDNYHLHKKDDDIRSVCFYCYYDKLFAQPVKEVEGTGGINSYEVKTCQEAISVVD